MDALELLIGDHNRVKGLFAQFNEAHEADDLATQRDVAARIFTELEVHTDVEETVFYPVVQDLDDEIHDTVVEGLEEHRVAKDLIAEAKALDPLTGWVGSGDMLGQVRLNFESREQAVAYAAANGIAYEVEATPPSAAIKPKVYADNFRFGRLENWSH